MSIKNNAELESFLFDYLRRKSPELTSMLGRDSNLLEEGILDSFSFVEMLVGLNKHFGIEFDLEELSAIDAVSVRSLAEKLCP